MKRHYASQDISFTKQKNETARLFFIFFLFFVLGIGGTVLTEKIHPVQTQFLTKESIVGVIGMQWNYRELWLQCLINRAGIMMMLSLLSYTSIGIWAFCILDAWFSLSMGILMERLTLLYGICGIGIFAVGTFPHYLFYIFAYIFAYKRCCHIRLEGSKNPIAFLFVFGVVIIGTLLESYVNPFLLKNFLKLFTV